MPFTGTEGVKTPPYKHLKFFRRSLFYKKGWKNTAYSWYSKGNTA